MAHLLGIISARSGVSRPKPWLGETKTPVSGVVVSGLAQPTPAPIVVVVALQTELHDRHATQALHAAEVLPSASAQPLRGPHPLAL